MSLEDNVCDVVEVAGRIVMSTTLTVTADLTHKQGWMLRGMKSG
ncbi:hypothetical protein HanXRQr2_Chr05g0209221 [Helianthus annuus]|uniref:Uncharacterized protein n=1 Tax=Helianthus annuus TaxID=4232 RepID=A0A9K3IYM8_HELAN|nr:hypothetical protein HanXRQr2_Chr05g0209221 [Helianthus annuus]